MKRLWQGAGLAVLALSFVYLVRFALRHAGELPRLRWSGPALAAFAAAILLYVLALLAGALAWHLLLRSSTAGDEPRPGLRRILGIHLISHAAKYLPGNVGQYVGRAAMARQEGMDLGHVLFALVAETACAVVAGVIFAAAMLDPGSRDLFVDRLGPGRLAAVVLIAILAALVGGRLAGHPTLRRLARLPPSSTAPATPGPAIWISCLGLSWLSFTLLGVCALLLLRGFLEPSSGPSPAALPALAGLFAAAWVAGFVTPGAPAGLGVREAVLVAGLNPLYGPEVALALPLLCRLISVLGDGVAFLAGTLVRRTPSNRLK